MSVESTIGDKMRLARLESEHEVGRVREMDLVQRAVSGTLSEMKLNEVRRMIFRNVTDCQLDCWESRTIRRLQILLERRRFARTRM